MHQLSQNLFVFNNRFFFVYKKTHIDYIETKIAMNYYSLHRRLDDISECVNSIANDNLALDEMEKSNMYLQKECVELDRFYCQ